MSCGARVEEIAEHELEHDLFRVTRLKRCFLVSGTVCVEVFAQCDRGRLPSALKTLLRCQISDAIELSGYRNKTEQVTVIFVAEIESSSGRDGQQRNGYAESDLSQPAHDEREELIPGVDSVAFTMAEKWTGSIWPLSSSSDLEVGPQGQVEEGILTSHRLRWCRLCLLSTVCEEFIFRFRQ
ncbi:hypothetical protein AC579_803 [Pseudocercospora musae]|uniref:Uncharacterized protein n=1 Tax=Pseudocercospora musae TaxID=113226 RepID=A0A139IHA3_9PEZI|nr:hypothetical protein AC579_803 [Pseudocercospora musae]